MNQIRTNIAGSLQAANSSALETSIKQLGMVKFGVMSLRESAIFLDLGKRCGMDVAPNL